MISGKFNRAHLEKLDKLDYEKIEKNLVCLDKYDIFDLWDFVSDDYVDNSIDFKYPNVRNVLFDLVRQRRFERV